MRVFWLIFLFSGLMSMGLVMVIMGQHKEMDIINKKTEELKKAADQFYKRLQNEDNLKASFEKLLNQGDTGYKDLEPEVTSLTSEVEKKKQESDTCQAELKTLKEEVESEESTQTQNTEAAKAEAEKWKGEISTLTAELAENSKICNFVPLEKRPIKFCANKTNEKEVQ